MRVLGLGLVLLACAAGCDRNRPPPPIFTPLDITVDPTGGVLVVFVQPGAGDMDRLFVAETLPKLREMSREIGARLAWLDARAGAPEEVTATPMIFYQNVRGRMVFLGSPHDLERLASDVRAFRASGPSGDTDLEIDDPLLTPRRSNVPVVTWDDLGMGLAEREGD